MVFRVHNDYVRHRPNTPEFENILAVGKHMGSPRAVLVSADISVFGKKGPATQNSPQVFLFFAKYGSHFSLKSESS